MAGIGVGNTENAAGGAGVGVGVGSTGDGDSGHKSGGDDLKDDVLAHLRHASSWQQVCNAYSSFRHLPYSECSIISFSPFIGSHYCCEWHMSHSNTQWCVDRSHSID